MKTLPTFLRIGLAAGIAGFGFVSAPAAGKPDESNQHVIWAPKPLVLESNPQRPRMYFQQAWGSGVYPIGNGRLGATIYGGIAEERIQFNEDSLWSGDEENLGAYQNFGRLFIALEGHAEVEADNYRRELDIDQAVHTITYTLNGVNYRRDYFASNPANVMVFRLTADKPGACSGSVHLFNAHGHNDGTTYTVKGNTITFTGRIKPQTRNMEYEAQAMILNQGGSIRVEDNRIVFKDCDSLTILLDAGTDYLNQRDKGWKREHPHDRISARLAAAAKRSCADLLAEHISDYQGLFNRLTLDLGKTPEAIRTLPTGERLNAYRKTQADPDLEETLYQYARYLMISCSRPGTLPANLQGLWNSVNWPPWRCDYHTDVNVQMNYWFVDQANLSECFQPLAEWVNSIREVRREATKKEYGVRGWATRSMNNIFGGASYHWVPGDAAWVAQNLWDHYAFTLDKEYLRNRAYPVMKELCWYWEDSLIERPAPSTGSEQAGTLVSPKSQSPEHGPFAEGNSYEQQLCWDLFTNFIEASEALGVDTAYRTIISNLRDRLLGPQIGKWGQLQEWAEDLDDPKDTHRHLSHLIAVHPGRQISPETTPEWAEAARVSMNARGDGSTGWSKAWKICIWARLHDGDRAYKLASEFIQHNVYPNLWGFHPPFQIDCNFGYAAGVGEMLAQSHLRWAKYPSTQQPKDLRKAETPKSKSLLSEPMSPYLIHLLPALPKAWPDGHVNGMRVRGGFEVDIAWKDGTLEKALIRNISNPEETCLVRYGESTVTVHVPHDKEVVVDFTHKGK
ncbi:MAG: glycoside hydrolase family 95 protein [Lentisphaeria bacterium]|nr:glycoside hydrolase family 95 protein [Lentisphaeria bacterium]